MPIITQNINTVPPAGPLAGLAGVGEGLSNFVNQFRQSQQLGLQQRSLGDEELYHNLYPGNAKLNYGAQGTPSTGNDTGYQPDLSGIHFTAGDTNPDVMAGAHLGTVGNSGSAPMGIQMPPAGSSPNGVGMQIHSGRFGAFNGRGFNGQGDIADGFGGGNAVAAQQASQIPNGGLLPGPQKPGVQMPPQALSQLQNMGQGQSATPQQTSAQAPASSQGGGSMAGLGDMVQQYMNRVPQSVTLADGRVYHPMMGMGAEMIPKLLQMANQQSMLQTRGEQASDNIDHKTLNGILLTLPEQTRQKILAAMGESPIHTQTAVNTATGTAPIEIKKAVDIANGTLPAKEALKGTAPGVSPLMVQRQAQSEVGALAKTPLVSTITKQEAMYPQLMQRIQGAQNNPQNLAGGLADVMAYLTSPNGELSPRLFKSSQDLQGSAPQVIAGALQKRLAGTGASDIVADITAAVQDQHNLNKQLMQSQENALTSVHPNAKGELAPLHQAVMGNDQPTGSGDLAMWQAHLQNPNLTPEDRAMIEAKIRQLQGGK